MGKFQSIWWKNATICQKWFTRFICSIFNHESAGIRYYYQRSIFRIINLRHIFAESFMNILKRYRSFQHDGLLALNSQSQVIETATGPIEYAAYGTHPVILVSHGSFGGFDLGISSLYFLQDTNIKLISPSRYHNAFCPSPCICSITGCSENWESRDDRIIRGWHVCTPVCYKSSESLLGSNHDRSRECSSN